MPNVRIRGKIPRDEWPKIASRFQKGETLTEIARSYGCTAPAIRYIVARSSPGGARPKMNRDRLEKGALLSPPAENRRAPRIGAKEDRHNRGRAGSSSSSEAGDVWGRINTDITMFLAAMDTLSSDESVGNYEALLAATDRLLWAAARTRLELERILADRGKTSLRRLSN